MNLLSLEERVERIPESGCWIWMGGTSSRGYGRAYLRETRSAISAHRLSWQIANGPIPQGLFVCHRCDVPPCINPSHLFLGTNRDNALDCIRKGRHPGTEGTPLAVVEGRRERIKAAKAANSSLTIAQLASMFCCSMATVQKSCEGLPKGARDHYRRLTERDVLVIRYRALVLGERPSALGREFRLKPNYVFNILSGKRWKRLPFPQERPGELS